MAKHTPGPWAVEDPMDFELAIVEAGKQAYEWKFIATLQHGKNEFPRTVVEANARLIAAAPELLNALKKAVEYCGCTVSERYSGHVIGCPVPEWHELIDKVTSAQRTGA